MFQLTDYWVMSVLMYFYFCVYVFLNAVSQQTDVPPTGTFLFTHAGDESPWVSVFDSRASSSNIPKVGSKRWSCGQVSVALKHFTNQFLLRGRSVEQDQARTMAGVKKGGEEEIRLDKERGEEQTHSIHAKTIVTQKLLSRGWVGQWAQSAGQGPTIGSAVTICVKPTVRSGPHQSRLWLRVCVSDIPTVSER